MSVYPEIAEFLEATRPEPDARRREQLEQIVEFIRAHDPAELVFVCTHNSRRSHLAQLWAHAAAVHHGLAGRVRCFSGGTEATAFHPHAVEALRGQGFRIDVARGGGNPVYRVRVGDGAPEIGSFSKRYDDPPNPTGDFCAVMVCAEADAGCPFVAGAVGRVSLPFDDPKESDGSGRESEAYAAASRRIAAEMAWVMRRAAG